MTLSTKRPTRQTQTTATKIAGGKPRRLVLELAPATLRAIKVKAATEGKTVKAYLVGLARADGADVTD
jgi:hypothetical protein